MGLGVKVMDADTIRRLEPHLLEYVEQFRTCFSRSSTWRHLLDYVRGQLSELPRKSVEPLALDADKPVRTLQEFLTHLVWDEDRVRRQVAQIVAEEHAHPQSIGLIDETGCIKKGNKTPGVARQYCRSAGRRENCIVTVHLGYATDRFHCLLDGDLYLPKSWDEDRQRCREAGIPDEVVYRPKTHIATELYDRAVTNGVRFQWLTFDDRFGAELDFLRALAARGQKFVAEVPRSFRAGIDRPRAARNSEPQTVEQLAQSHPRLAGQAGTRWRIRGPLNRQVAWLVKHAPFHLQDERGLADGPYHLLVCAHARTGGVKYMLSNAPAETPLKAMLRVGLGRLRLQRRFDDARRAVGLTHWEGRRWLGLKRHLVLTTVSYLFLAEACQHHGRAAIPVGHSVHHA